MSYILDALKKSESERLERDAPRFADLPSGGRSRQASRWPWVLAALLAVNAAILAAYLFRGDGPAADTGTRPVAIPAADPPVAAVERPEPPPASETAAEPKPAGATAASAAPATEASAAARPVTEAPPPAEPPPVEAAAPPRPTATYMELLANGRLSLPALHLDIHVFSDTPAERFIFVNMQKYREGERLAEGPLVSEIRPEGVVLEHRGTAFLLPRE